MIQREEHSCDSALKNAQIKRILRQTQIAFYKATGLYSKIQS